MAHKRDNQDGRSKSRQGGNERAAMTDQTATGGLAGAGTSSSANVGTAQRNMCALAPRRVTVTLEGHGEGSGSTEERVLVILERAQGFGLLKNMPRRLPVGCRRGGCGVCRVKVSAGEFRSSPMSRAHISAEEEAEGIVLACAIYPLGDLRLSLEPMRLEKNGRKAEKSQGGE
jgi:ferredoxin